MLQLLLLHLLESLSINRYELSLIPVLNKLVLFLLWELVGSYSYS